MTTPNFLITLSFVSSATVALTWIATFLLRRQSAALRHFIWLLALALSLLAFPLSLLSTRVNLPLLPPAANSVPARDSAFTNKPPPQSSSATSHTNISSAPIPHSVPPVLPPSHFTPPINLWVALWILGVVSVFLRIIYSQLRVRRLVRTECSPAPAELVRRLNQIRQHFDFTRPVRVMVTPLTEIPFCFGVFRSIVIFPESWREWDEARVEVCLTHELAHIIRGDLLAMTLAQTACVVCWFNPFVWFAAARLRDEAENSADDLVLAQNIRPETYASNLVAITEQYRASTLSPLIALSMARPTRLTSRIEAILDGARSRKAPGSLALFSISLLTAAALLSVMLTRLTAAPAPAAPPEKIDITKLNADELNVLWNSLYDAIKSGDIQTVQSLLDRGFDVNGHSSGNTYSNSSPLYTAVSDKQLAIVNLLLSRGADVNQKTSWHDTAIDRACWLGQKDITDALIKSGAKPNDLLYATGMGDVAALEALNKKEPVTDKKAKWAIDFAVSSGHQNTFDWLWTKLGALDATQKDKLLAHLYELAGKWNQPEMFPHLEQLGATPAKDGPDALGYAIAYNNLEAAKYLLDKGVTANPPGQNLVRDAAGEGRLELVKLLLDHGGDPSTGAGDGSGRGMTPLGWAAYRGRDEVCKYLIEHGADGSVKDDQGQNAAWYTGGGVYSPDILEMLIKKGVPVTGTNKNGQEILSAVLRYMPPRAGRIGFPGKISTEAEIAAYKVRERRTYDLLIAAGANVNAYEPYQSALLNAIAGGHADAARALIDHGANINFKDAQGNTALSHISQWAWLFPLPTDILEIMLKKGCDPNTLFYPDAEGKEKPVPIPVLEEAMTTALRSTTTLAAAPLPNTPERQESYQQAVKLLLQYGAVFPGVTDDKIKALLQAAARGDLKGIQDAVAQGVSVNSTDGGKWTALTITLALGYKDCTDWLLKNGADPATQTVQGYSPLFFAANAQDADLVESFIARGAKPGPGDYSGLVQAVVNQNIRVFNDLVKAGADAKSVDLFPSIQHGQVAMAKVLLDAGANPNQPHPNENRDNVYWAVYYDQPEILKMLLDHGADPNLKDDYGQTPLAMAKQFHQACVPLLEEAIKRAEAKK